MSFDNGCHWVVDYYTSTAGSTLLFVTSHASGVVTLLDTITTVVESADGGLDLALHPDFSLCDSLERLVLRCTSHSRGKSVIQTEPRSFEWRNSVQGWDDTCEMLQPLLRTSGHQYLTSAPRDKVIVEVSRGEQLRRSD